LWTVDVADSPAIDAGDTSSVFNLEPAPNGKRIDLGSYGDTLQASHSRAEIIQLLTFTGSEKVRQGIASSILWRSVGFAAGERVNIDFSSNGGQNFTRIASNELNDGAFPWNPATTTLTGLLRISSADPAKPKVVDTSKDVFVVGSPGNIYYVDDGSDTGDQYTPTAIGNNANSGTTPNDPVASINAILNSYDLNLGDTILVDNGTYSLRSNVRILAQDSGVQITGPTLPGKSAVLNRGNYGSGRDAIEINGANDVTIQGLSLTGAEVGLAASAGARITITSSLAFDNAVYGFYLNPDINVATVQNNTAYGTGGNGNTDQDYDFYLRGSNALIDGNTAYRVGPQNNNYGILVDASSNTILRNNLVYNTTYGFTVTTGQSQVYNNESRNNARGIYLYDTDGSARSPLYNNNVHDNTSQGIWVENNADVYQNLVRDTAGSGIYGSYGAASSLIHDNTVMRNAEGIRILNGNVSHNRVFGNTASGIVLDYAGTTVNANTVFGNSVGIEVVAYYPASTISNNVVYDNANQGIFVHDSNIGGSTPLQIVNNTVYHDVGDAIKLQNNGANIHLYNNIIFINAGLGIEVIGGVTGFDSNYNDIFPGKPGASVGKYLASPTSATLAAWRTATGTDANSISADPVFIDINGPDNLLGWEQPDPQSQFADYGKDDNFHLFRGSPAIDAADSEVAPALDADSAARSDDLGTINTGNGVYRFYEMGAYEFTGSSSDITPPKVTNLTPVGMIDGAFTTVSFTQITISFTEPLLPVSALSTALYSLIEAGPNATFGNPDDVVIPIKTISYTAGDTNVVVTFQAAIPQGYYQLTLISNPPNAIFDQAGNALDGDVNGSAGGNFVRTFRVDPAAPVPTLLSPAPGSTVSSDQGYVDIKWVDTGTGLNAATIGTDDITITGVDVDSVQSLGGGVYRYIYNADGDVLPGGTITVSTVTGAVADIAGGTTVAGPIATFQRSGSGINGTSGDDIFYVRLSAAGNIEIFQNVPNAPSGVPTYSLTPGSINKLNINTLDGNDQLVVDFANGNPIPAGGLFYDGGSQSATPGDSLTVKGTAALSGVYTPSAATAGDGVINVGPAAITFTGLEPVTVSDFLAFSLVTPKSADILTLDTPIAGRGRITGSSGGTAFESLAFFNTASVIIDTATNDAGGTGDDSITIAASGVAATGLNILKFNVGAGANSLTVNGGTLTLDASLGSGGATLSLTVNNSAVVTLPASQRLAALNLNNSAKVNFPTNGNLVLDLAALSVGPTTTLDLNDNDMIVHGTAATRAAVLTAVSDLIKSARNNGAWTGFGITSAAAKSNPKHITGLAVILNGNNQGNTLYTAFDTRPVDFNTVLVKYSYNGDTDLNGTIDADDYFQIDNGFVKHLTTYRNGDLDFNGVVDADDYFLIDNAFANKTGILSTAAPSAITPAHRTATPHRSRIGRHHTVAKTK
jgi:parallel beta-helix repeat protein